MTKLKVDIETLRELAELLTETGLTEIEWEQEDVRVRLGRQIQTVHAAMAPVAGSPAATAAAAAPAAGGSDEPFPNATKVLSPMVGTVYVAAEPGAAPFVKVGDSVTKGQTVMIVEAMKTMNPVPATATGRVVAVLVENEQPVEYEQPLVLIA
ncbi:MAG: acetyl-CoA carboxylase biotin carboxyl carrier protein [Pseudomonadota bacterium]|nr:acetyl-CoA carboxylase biotin carboxyl carrier protein [Pseudomonadota bacterium]